MEGGKRKKTQSPKQKKGDKVATPPKDNEAYTSLYEKPSRQL